MTESVEPGWYAQAGKDPKALSYWDGRQWVSAPAKPFQEPLSDYHIKALERLSLRNTPAGWYKNPLGTRQIARWWDGNKWTDHVGHVIRLDGDMPIPKQMMTTLPILPGYRVTANYGIVTTVGAHAGLTAQSKGLVAQYNGFMELSKQADALGANAIIGLRASAFAAGGGLTNVFGGDAVGVLMLGTAVYVAPDPASE